MSKVEVLEEMEGRMYSYPYHQEETVRISKCWENLMLTEQTESQMNKGKQSIGWVNGWRNKIFERSHLFRAKKDRKSWRAMIANILKEYDIHKKEDPSAMSKRRSGLKYYKIHHSPEESSCRNCLKRDFENYQTNW